MSTPTPDTPTTHPPTPITILTGFLGSGKTTLLLSLLPQLPPTYTLALLKNELGCLPLDSQLASAASVAGVRELLNGCICCNLVGQLSDALQELREGRVAVAVGKSGGESDGTEQTGTRKRPDRIVIETSGAAFPATLVLELNRLIRASITSSTNENPAYTLDGVIQVIDVENWEGYPDTGVTARMQAKFTDLVVLNKWEACTEERREWVRDRVGDLDDGGGDGAAVVWSQMGKVEVGLLMGTDGALIAKRGDEDEIRGLEVEGKHDAHEHGHKHKDDGTHSEVEVLSVTLSLAPDAPKTRGIHLQSLDDLLYAVPKDEIYRIKAILYIPESDRPRNSDLPRTNVSSASTSHSLKKYILNWAFGRWTWTSLSDRPFRMSALNGENESDVPEDQTVCRMTFVTAKYESTKWKRRLENERLIVLSGADHDDGKGILKVEKVG